MAIGTAEQMISGLGLGRDALWKALAKQVPIFLGQQIKDDARQGRTAAEMDATEIGSFALEWWPSMTGEKKQPPQPAARYRKLLGPLCWRMK